MPRKKENGKPLQALVGAEPIFSLSQALYFHFKFIPIDRTFLCNVVVVVAHKLL